MIFKTMIVDQSNIIKKNTVSLSHSSTHKAIPGQLNMSNFGRRKKVSLTIQVTEKKARNCPSTYLTSCIKKFPTHAGATPLQCTSFQYIIVHIGYNKKNIFFLY